MIDETLPTVNFEVEEKWWMSCPNCGDYSKAPFNVDNPMQPLEITCDECGKPFILTYERD